MCIFSVTVSFVASDMAASVLPRAFQYGELPEHIRINDTDVIFEGEDKENQEYFDFDDIAGLLGVWNCQGTT